MSAETSGERLPRAAPFDAVAAEYDADFTDSVVGRAQREAVWRELGALVGKGTRLLDLGCGSGEDALRAAALGARVTALDASERMLAEARRKLEAVGAVGQVRLVPARIEELVALPPETLGAPFDVVLSNFSALNCVEDLPALGASLARLVPPEGSVVAVVFGRFCPWEILHRLLRLEPGKAFRRLRSRGVARIGGQEVALRYFGAARLARELGPRFRLRRTVGIGLLVPPSALEPLARRWPRVVALLALLERPVARLAAPFADHLLVVLTRESDPGAR